MRNLGAISSADSKAMFLKNGAGFISCVGTFNTASVSVQFETSTRGTWQAFADGAAKTSNFQYTVDTVGVPVNVRVNIDSGAPTGTLQCDGGVDTDNANAND